MESPLKHIITAPDLELHADLFPEDAIVGQEVELSEEALTALGLEIHTITDFDISEAGAFHDMGFVVGDKIERALVPVDEENTSLDD